MTNPGFTVRVAGTRGVEHSRVSRVRHSNDGTSKRSGGTCRASQTVPPKEDGLCPPTMPARDSHYSCPQERAALALLVGLSGEDESAEPGQDVGHRLICRKDQRDLIATRALMPNARHIPPRLMVTWLARRSTLTGLERRFVISHVRSCLDCRREARMLRRYSRI